jgi:hypothetical protein
MTPTLHVVPLRHAPRSMQVTCVQDLLFRHSRPSSSRPGTAGSTTAGRSHARTPRGTKVSCCFAPTGQSLCLLSFIPALLVVGVVVVRRNLNKLVRLCFWRARCVYRTILAYHVCAQSTSYVKLRTPKSSHVQAGLRIWERGYTVHVPTMSFIGNECTFTS